MKLHDNGELVKTSYVTSHAFLGQIVKEVDVCAVTIARGIDRLKGK